MTGSPLLELPISFFASRKALEGYGQATQFSDRHDVVDYLGALSSLVFEPDRVVARSSSRRRDCNSILVSSS